MKDTPFKIFPIRKDHEQFPLRYLVIVLGLFVTAKTFRCFFQVYSIYIKQKNPVLD
jgi:hypothetical protein